MTVVLVVLVAILSAAILIPPPTLAMMPLSIATPELSPWFILVTGVLCAAALRFCRPILPLAIASLLVFCWPTAQIHRVVVRSSKQGKEKVRSAGGTLAVVRNCFFERSSPRVEPQRLPLNILYYPPSQGSAPHPALIDIYGGAWQHGSPEQSQYFDSEVARLGFAVFSIDYRHAPAFRFPAQLHDVEAALDFIRKNSPQYNVDSERLVLCGRSAGAQLALLAAYSNTAVPFRAVISYYGPTDLVSGYTNLPHPDPIGARSVLTTYLGGTPSELPAAYRAASPVNYVKASLPATLLIQGGHDHIVKADYAVELYQHLVESGNRAELLVVPWSEHAFDFVSSGLGNQVSFPYVSEFLQETTRKD